MGRGAAPFEVKPPASVPGAKKPKNRRGEEELTPSEASQKLEAAFFATQRLG
jgi:hypothetical protein